MISSLKGKISRIGNNFIEIEVHDVGYLVHGPAVAKAMAGKAGQEVKIYTYMSVSENDISLYGFETIDDVNLFKMLISVSGIGPKTAAQIMGQAESGEIVKAIGEADVKFFEKVKGIGKKGAQRIIVDLKSKIGGLGELDLTQDDTKIKDDDLSLSLKQLGFDRKEIEKVTAKIPTELETIEEKLEWCLSKI